MSTVEKNGVPKYLNSTTKCMWCGCEAIVGDMFLIDEFPVCPDCHEDIQAMPELEYRVERLERLVEQLERFVGLE